MGAKREFTNEEKQLIYNSYYNGEKIKNIKKELHCSAKTLNDFINLNGYHRKRVNLSKRRVLTEEEIDIVKQMCESNTLKEICKAIQCSEKILLKYMQENNINYIKKKGAPKTLTNEEFLYKLSLVTDKIIPLENYKKRSEKISFKCLDCGHIWSAQPGNILNGEGCPKCCFNSTYTNEEFRERIKEINDEIIVLGDYNGSLQPIECECKKCGHIWTTKATYLVRGCGCPICKESNGERAIRKYCENNQISFEPQKTYEGLVGVGGKSLSYDFYLPSYNLLIEYQGEYHDGTVLMQTEEEFLKQQEHDRRKREYTVTHNIDLLEIWYYDFDNIENILTQYTTK